MKYSWSTSKIWAGSHLSFSPNQAQITTLRKILDKSKWTQKRQIIRRRKSPLNPLITSKKIILRGLYTWLFNSSNASAQDFLAKESSNHHRYGPLAWKLLTTKIVRGVKQGICCAQYIILRFPFKALTNDLMLLSNFSKESVVIMFCAQQIPCLTPRTIFVVSSFQARGPYRWWLLLSLARKSWADLLLELKSQV